MKVSLLLQNQEIKLVNLSLNNTINSGITGNLEFLGPSLSFTESASETFLNLESGRLRIVITRFDYDFKNGHFSADFSSFNTKNVHEKYNIDWLGDGGSFQSLSEVLGRTDLPFIIPNENNVPLSVYGLTGGFIIENLNSICTDFGLCFAFDLQDNIHILNNNADATVINNILRSSLKKDNKELYTGVTATKIQSTREQFLANGQYMTGGNEEKAEYEEKQASTGETPTDYDLTALVTWPNYPDQQQYEKMPKITRENCIKYQKEAIFDIKYFRHGAEHPKGERDAPLDLIDWITEVEITGEEDFFAYISFFSADIDKELIVSATHSPAYSYFLEYDINFKYNLYSKSPDYALNLGISGTFASPWDNLLNLTETGITIKNGAEGDQFKELCKNSAQIFTDFLGEPHTYSSAPLQKGELPKMAAVRKSYVYANNYAALGTGTASLTTSIGSKKWCFLTRDVTFLEQKEVSFTSETSGATLKDSIYKKMKLGKVKFTPDFDLYDPDNISKKYNTEVATSSETAQRFEPTAHKPSGLDNNFYITPCTWFLSEFDQKTVQDVPVWNKTHLYPKGAGFELASIGAPAKQTADPSGIKYENEQESLFLPVCRFSLSKNRVIKDPYELGKHAVGIQRKTDFGSQFPTGAKTAQGVYTTADKDPTNNEENNLKTGFDNVINPIISPCNAGEAQTIRAVNTADDSLCIKYESEEQGEKPLLISSALYPFDKEIIENSGIRALENSNSGTYEININTVYSADAFLITPAFRFWYNNLEYKIKSVNYDFRQNIINITGVNLWRKESL